MIVLTSAYFFTNFGFLIKDKPIKSSITKTCPSQNSPAPIPIVGIASSSVILFANFQGTDSITMPKVPASSKAFASFNSWF